MAKITYVTRISCSAEIFSTKNNKHLEKQKTTERISFVCVCVFVQKCIENIWLNVSSERTASFIDSDWMLPLCWWTQKQQQQTAKQEGKRHKNEQAINIVCCVVEIEALSHTHTNTHRASFTYLHRNVSVRSERESGIGRQAASTMNDAIYLLFLLLFSCSSFDKCENAKKFAILCHTLLCDDGESTSAENTCKKKIRMYYFTDCHACVCICQCVALLVRWSHRHRKIP